MTFWIRIRRIGMFSGFPDPPPDPLVRGRIRGSASRSVPICHGSTTLLFYVLRIAVTFPLQSKLSRVGGSNDISCWSKLHRRGLPSFWKNYAPWLEISVFVVLYLLWFFRPSLSLHTSCSEIFLLPNLKWWKNCVQPVCVKCARQPGAGNQHHSQQWAPSSQVSG